MADETPLVDYKEVANMTVGTVGAGTQLDAAGANAFADDVIEFLNAHPGLRLLLNFQNITYLSSAALTELLRINKAADALGASLKLCGVSRDINKVFEVTKLSDVFHIDTDEDVEKTIVRINNDSEREVFDN